MREAEEVRIQTARERDGECNGVQQKANRLFTLRFFLGKQRMVSKLDSFDRSILKHEHSVIFTVLQLVLEY